MVGVPSDYFVSTQLQLWLWLLLGCDNNIDKERSILKGKGLLSEGEIISKRLFFLL